MTLIIEFNAWNATWLVNLGTLHRFAWIQHEFNMNATPLWCKVLHEALWNSRYKWNQHEFSMKSAWIRHQPVTLIQKQRLQPNLSQILKNFEYNTKSKNHRFCLNSAWIPHGSDTNENIVFEILILHAFSMNSTWIQHHPDSQKLSGKCKKSNFFCGGLDWRFGFLGLQKLISSPYWGNARIQHESSMKSAWTHFSTFRLPKIPNHQSKTPFTQILSDFLNRIRFVPLSCRIQAYFHICRIHIRFMPDSVEFSLAIHPHSIRLFSCCFFSQSCDSCWIHVEFMLISFSPWISEGFVQYFPWQWCWIHVEFMLNPCWIQANPLQVSFFQFYNIFWKNPDYVHNGKEAYNTPNPVECFK